MNFSETIFPLTQLLTSNHFTIAESSQNFIKYTSESVIITIAYSNLEYLFYTHVGKDSNSLIELTPLAVKTVFDEDSFQFQSTLTIENLISLLKDKGQSILLGDKTKLTELEEFNDRRLKEFTERIIHLQHLKAADYAWEQKDYHRFIECIEQTNQKLLAPSYLKKYKIAMDRLSKQNK